MNDLAMPCAAADVLWKYPRTSSSSTWRMRPLSCWSYQSAATAMQRRPQLMWACLLPHSASRTVCAWHHCRMSIDSYLLSYVYQLLYWQIRCGAALPRCLQHTHQHCIASSRPCAHDIRYPNRSPPGSPSTGSGDGVLRAKSGNAHIAAVPRQSELDRARPDDVALFLHTSGTTSRPKGIGYAHTSVHYVPFCISGCWLCPLAQSTA